MPYQAAYKERRHCLHVVITQQVVGLHYCLVCQSSWYVWGYHTTVLVDENLVLAEAPVTSSATFTNPKKHVHLVSDSMRGCAWHAEGVPVQLSNRTAFHIGHSGLQLVVSGRGSHQTWVLTIGNIIKLCTEMVLEVCGY